MRHCFYVLTFLLLPICLFAQAPVPENLYGIKNPQADGGKGCVTCLSVLSTMPADVKLGLAAEGEDLYFIMSDVRWFDKLFSKAGDGIAIDIIPREYFDCALKTSKKAKSWAYKGYLMKPLFLKDMKNNASVTETGEIYIKAGKIPAEFLKGDLEFNMLLLSNKFLCRYNAFYDVPGHKWGLLEMGLYMDTLRRDKTPGKQTSVVFSKKMKFEIPFEKNKYEYSSADVKPLYDSLRLNDYDIKSISIRAYSSIEGPADRNIELQEKRAESIVKVLQSFQMDTIQKDIHASENWVEFLEDISETKYASLKTLSKSEIKQKLENKQFSQELEPILKKHRKAILLIDLEKKSAFKHDDPDKLRDAFNHAIEEKNLEEALELQQLIFSRIRSHKLPMTFTESLEIPETYEYGTLLNNYAVFTYEHDEADIVSALKNFEKLQLLLPANKNIRYNIVALKLKSWVYGQLIAEPEELKKEILELEKSGFDKRLIKRMMINYHIIWSEYLYLRKEYAEKDKAVKYIYTNYTSLNLDDSDLLNLSKYFAGYSKYDWAESILRKKVVSVDVKEDLLFYYINLTIIRDNVVASSHYRAIMLNAINQNKERFCSLFKPFGKGGITFQLLGNEYLRKTYCENCE